MPKVGAVEIVGLGPVSVATTLWRSLGILRATAVVKATFTLVPGGAMTVAEAAPLSGTEVHYANNPMRSVRAGSDLSPFLKKADVLLVGHAYPPGGAPSPRSTVRLAVLRNDWALIDKTLTVLGDRTVAAPEPAPFKKMPIVYERAFGGIGSAENPLGAGVGSAKDRALPNFVHAAEDRTDPAGFGPISWSWPARRRRLRGFARKQLSEPIAEIPDDFDLEFFQASPLDQRTTYLRGDEVLVLEGLNPTHARLETVLPGVRGAARVYTADGIEINVTLHADTLFIDGDAEQCSITWRGSFPVASEEALPGLRILAGVESAGRPIAWPTPARLEAARPPLPSSPTPSAAPANAPPEAWEGTYTIDVKGDEPRTLAAPFAIATPGASLPSAHPPIPGSPWAPQESSPRAQMESESGFAGTRVITDESSTQVLSTVSLIHAVPVDVGVTVAPEDPWGMTHVLSSVEQDAPRAATTPFAIAEPGAARGSARAPIPGAPWAFAKAQRPPPPKPRAAMETMATIDILDPVPPDDEDDEDDVTTKAISIPRRAPPPEAASVAVIEPAPEIPKIPEIPAIDPLAAVAPVAPIAAVAPVAAEPPVEPGRAWSWVSVAPAASTIEADAPRPLPPKPVLNKKLYGGFGSKKS